MSDIVERLQTTRPADAFVVMVDAAAEIERLRAVNAELVEALGEVEEYFDDRADAEYHTDSAQPQGNEEMHLLVLVRAAIAKARSAP